MGHDQTKYWPGESAVAYEKSRASVGDREAYRLMAGVDHPDDRRQPTPGVYDDAQVRPLVTWGALSERLAAITQRITQAAGHLQVSASRLDGDFEMAPSATAAPRPAKAPCVPEMLDLQLDDLTMAANVLEDVMTRISRRL